MQQIIFASSNQSKLAELEDILSGHGDNPWQLLPLNSVEGVNLPPETGKTFISNAVLKAEAVAAATNSWALADDSGLQVDALCKAPGVYSARYSGVEGDDRRNLEQLLLDMINVSPDARGAEFVTALALAIPGQATRVTRGSCQGVISLRPRGEGGFGYDPIFLLTRSGKTLAELSKDEKNRLSHRAVAALRMRTILNELLCDGVEKN